MSVVQLEAVQDTAVTGDAVWLWNMETDEVQKVWSAWDHLDWELDRGRQSRPDDWLHANAIPVGPCGNLVVSFHFLNQVISIAPDYQSVEWRMGRHQSNQRRQLLPRGGVPIRRG